MGKNIAQKKRKAFQMRIARHTLTDIAKKLKVAKNTLSKWESGYIDAKGRRYRGWKEELQRLWQEQDDEDLKCGLMVKKERLKAYDKLARMAIEKVEKQFPSIKAKTPADAKALLSEIRELCRLIAVEKGEYPASGGNQTLIAVKTDISLSELQKRYKNAQGNSEEESD
jgi:transcriptional regulator with XRE-family HTH domain